MSKIISQTTFDDAVRENIIEFDMNTADAKDETVKQFEAQGINLGNIIKDLNINTETGEPILNENLEKIKNHLTLAKEMNTNDLINSLHIVTVECNKSVPHKILAEKLNCAVLILDLIEKEILKTPPNMEIIQKSVLLEISLTDKNPDIFDDHSLLVITRLLDSSVVNKTIICNLLVWIQKACVMHENNRQNIMNVNFLKYLKPLIASGEAEIIKEICIVLRCLVLDDDIRLAFGKAHEHARTISAQFLWDLTKLLQKFKDNKDLCCELMLTIAALTVRHELCLVVKDAGGLEYIFEIMQLYEDEVRLLREAFKLIKALAGNDTVKVQIMQKGAAPIIENSLSKFKTNETFAKIILACITTLTLRVRENSLALFETGISDSIIDTMRIHEDNEAIQRNGSWAIRNMVSRSRDQCDVFLALGVEEILNNSMQKHTTISQDIKAALRDLGCKVHLNEEWKGVSDIQICN